MVHQLSLKVPETDITKQSHQCVHGLAPSFIDIVVSVSLHSIESCFLAMGWERVVDVGAGGALRELNVISVSTTFYK